MDNNKNKRMEQHLITLILIGVSAGILGGMVGVGGGIIIVPALVYFVGFSQLNAQGTSLALLVLPVGILGAFQYYQQGHVDLRVVLILALGFVVGSLIGSKISLHMPQEILKKVFAVFMILIAVKMLFLDKKGKQSNSADQQKTATAHHP
jgi:uncharacterized membrane protein YfcA